VLRILAKRSHGVSLIRPEIVEQLARSMKEHGLLQPVVVCPHKGGGYLLVAGLHRFEAAKKLTESDRRTFYREHFPANVD
jgi:ParB-like chromosome segregation protein Spo0J